jgi:hypothetical protein
MGFSVNISLLLPYKMREHGNQRDRIEVVKVIDEKS